MFVDRSVCVDLLKVCAIKMSFPWCSNFYLFIDGVYCEYIGTVHCFFKHVC